LVYLYSVHPHPTEYIMLELTSLKLDEVQVLSMEIFNAHGLSEEQPTAIADTVTTAERDDCESHNITDSLA